MPAIRILDKPHYLYRPRQVLRRLAFRPGAWTPSQTTVATLPWGAELECWPADGLGSAILRTGIYDLLATEALFRLTEPGDVVVDVGANVGHMTSALSRAAGPRGRAIAFEPHPDVHVVLHRNVARWRANGRMASVQLHASAASDEAGTVTLASDADFAANRGTSHIVQEGGEATDQGSRYHVTAVRMDEAVADAVGVLKLDCEGHERAALAGATRLLERGMIRDVVFEEFDAYPTPVTDLLEAAGLEIIGLGQRLTGPRTLAAGATNSRQWDPPVMVASRDASRVRRLMGDRGWRALGK